MEDAYDDLYREFVHLRTICLRQAALLQKLSRELLKQQGSNGYSDKDGSFGDMTSTLVQSGGAAPNQDSIPPLVATNRHAAPQTGEDHPRAAGLTTFSALLVEDMGRLGLHVTHQRPTDTADGPETLPPAPPGSRSPGSHEAHTRGDARVMQPYGTARYSPLDSDELINSSGAFMSEMELQSQVCEFCCATFPGNTASRGEFLRHLHTHIT